MGETANQANGPGSAVRRIQDERATAASQAKQGQFLEGGGGGTKKNISTSSGLDQGRLRQALTNVKFKPVRPVSGRKLHFGPSPDRGLGGGVKGAAVAGPITAVVALRPWPLGNGFRERGHSAGADQGRRLADQQNGITAKPIRRAPVGNGVDVVGSVGAAGNTTTASHAPRHRPTSSGRGGAWRGPSRFGARAAAAKNSCPAAENRRRFIGYLRVGLAQTESCRGPSSTRVEASWPWVVRDPLEMIDVGDDKFATPGPVRRCGAARAGPATKASSEEDKGKRRL